LFDRFLARCRNRAIRTFIKGDLDEETKSSKKTGFLTLYRSGYGMSFSEHRASKSSVAIFCCACKTDENIKINAVSKSLFIIIKPSQGLCKSI
jgi:hypothetical protein